MNLIPSSAYLSAIFVNALNFCFIVFSSYFAGYAVYGSCSSRLCMNFSRPSILARILSILYLRYLPCDLDVFPPACSSSLSRWAFQRQILYLSYIAVLDACMAALSSAFCSISPIRYSSLIRRMWFLYSFLRFFTSYAAFSAFSLMALRSSSRPFTKSEHSSEPRGIHSSFQPLALLTNFPRIAL